MLSFDEAREIAAQHYGEPFACEGVEDDGVCWSRRSASSTTSAEGS